MVIYKHTSLLYIHVYIYIYIYVYTHTHTYTRLPLALAPPPFQSSLHYTILHYTILDYTIIYCASAAAARSRPAPPFMDSFWLRTNGGQH